MLFTRLTSYLCGTFLMYIVCPISGHLKPRFVRKPETISLRLHQKGPKPNSRALAYTISNIRKIMLYSSDFRHLGPVCVFETYGENFELTLHLKCRNVTQVTDKNLRFFCFYLKSCYSPLCIVNLKKLTSFHQLQGKLSSSSQC